jgi:hypothetical protein
MRDWHKMREGMSYERYDEMGWDLRVGSMGIRHWVGLIGWS